VAGDDRVADLRKYGVVVADDPREDRLAVAQALEQVTAHLLLDRLPDVARRAELGDGLRQVLGHEMRIDKDLP